MTYPKLQTQHILLADDDLDDCLLFKEVLEELPLSTVLATANDGEQLMRLLKKENQLPDVLFLDLNMPRKSGFQCLSEIKQNEKLKRVPVIIFSTSFNGEIVNQLYENGAHYYIQKPNEFSELKKVINYCLIILLQGNYVQPPRKEFVLSSNVYEKEDK